MRQLVEVCIFAIDLPIFMAQDIFEATYIGMYMCHRLTNYGTGYLYDEATCVGMYMCQGLTNYGMGYL